MQQLQSRRGAIQVIRKEGSGVPMSILQQHNKWMRKLLELEQLLEMQKGFVFIQLNFNRRVR